MSRQAEAAKRAWAENLTLKEIEEYERQGLDMTETRVHYERHQREILEHKNSLAFEKLSPYKNACSEDDPFVSDVAQFNKLPDNKKSELARSPILYGRVVQAHWELLKPGASDFDERGIVFLFALDDAHRYDEEWLAKTAGRISELKEISNRPLEGTLGMANKLFNLESMMFVSGIIESQRLKRLPEDCRTFIGILRNDRSSFCFKLGPTLSEGANAWCASYFFKKASNLPQSRIPYNKIVPFLLSKPLVHDREASIALIPPQYYTK